MSDYGRKLQTLKRRLTYLEERVAASDASANALNYLKAEAAALRWALEVIQTLKVTKRASDDEIH